MKKPAGYWLDVFKRAVRITKEGKAKGNEAYLLARNEADQALEKGQGLLPETIKVLDAQRGGSQ